MEIQAPAKINLFLNAGSKRQDGYHEFLSIMVKVSLYDKITVSAGEDITLEGPDYINQEDNIAYKAAFLLKERTGSDKGCNIKLEKNIPCGAGLGGGSSDAAAVLTALNLLWELNLDTPRLEEIGALLGSDVNFFLHPGGCLAKGRGEVIEPLAGFLGEKNDIVLIDPGIELPTKSIYDSYPGGSLTSPVELDKIIRNYNEGKWSLILGNDLEETVFRGYPVLKDLKNRLLNWGANPLLSGSGACMFALTGERKLAESISGIVEKNFGFKSWIVTSLN